MTMQEQKIKELTSTLWSCIMHGNEEKKQSIKRDYPFEYDEAIKAIQNYTNETF